MAPRPNAAEMDQTKDPAVIPDAKANPDLLPDAIDVPAMASVAGPGLAPATKAAIKIRGRLISKGIVAHAFQDLSAAFPFRRWMSNGVCLQSLRRRIKPAPSCMGGLVVGEVDAALKVDGFWLQK